MREQMQERLRKLHAEFNAGQEILADLLSQEAEIRNTLVRISGAVQILEELLIQKEASPQSDTDGSSETATAAAA